jgi:hypothetical protein
MQTQTTGMSTVCKTAIYRIPRNVRVYSYCHSQFLTVLDPTETHGATGTALGAKSATKRAQHTRVLHVGATPFPRGLVVEAGLLAPGAYPPRLPSPPHGGASGRAPIARRGWHPQSQWRVRSGIAPASLGHRPMGRTIIGWPAGTVPPRRPQRPSRWRSRLSCVSNACSAHAREPDNLRPRI